MILPLHGRLAILVFVTFQARAGFAERALLAATLRSGAIRRDWAPSQAAIPHAQAKNPQTWLWAALPYILGRRCEIVEGDPQWHDRVSVLSK